MKRRLSINPRRINIFLRVFLALLFLSLYNLPAEAATNPFSSSSQPKLPEVPSTLLKLHHIYLSHPPHDSSLYKLLHVSPNATVSEVQKSYRKLSRQLHPDKQRRKTSYDQEQSARELERMQQAYQILKEDATRLPYHKYGLQDLSTAVLILTGYQNSPKLPNAEEIELLHLMGFHHQQRHHQPPPPPPRLIGQEQQNQQPPRSALIGEKQQHEQRVLFLAATIVERIRPLVEGTLSEQMVADFVATECDRLKKLPLGAHILRCVGRAYRHAGQRYLKQQKSKGNNLLKKKLWPARDSWHDAKHVWTAAIASGRVALKENWLLKTTAKNKRVDNLPKKPAIAYHWEGPMGGTFEEDEDFLVPITEDSDDDSEEDFLTDEELQQQEFFKSEKVMIELLQVEALWKVHKIGLNRAVKDACDLILRGDYFFFPSHQSIQPSSMMNDWQQSADGWVSASGGNYHQEQSAIDVREGKLRAAKALVIIGDILVQSSKEGTAWMD